MNKFIYDQNKTIKELRQLNSGIGGKSHTSKRVNEVGLISYAVNSLLMNNIFTLHDLTVLTVKEVAALPSICEADICRIAMCLQNEGLSFKADDWKGDK